MLEEGDIVQVIDETHPWFGCLIVVTEPKSWGIQGFVSWPESNEEHKLATAFTRLNYDKIKKVGHVVLELSGN